MSTYYGYVEQSAKDQINWGEIGKNISDMLNKQVEVREERRDEINKATNEITNTLNDTSILGQDQNANAWWQHNAGQLQDYMLMQHRLWKNGQLDNVTYKTNMENVKNNTNQLMQIFNNYNKYNDIRVKQAQDGKISGQGKFVFDNASQFANLNNTNLYINSVNGDMVVARKVLDPTTGQYVPDKSADGLKNIGALTSAMLTEYNTFDLDKALEAPVKNYGKKVFNELGGLIGVLSPEDVMTKVSDIRRNDDYRKSEDGIVNMIMNNPDAASSIYSDIVNTGLDYKELFTYSQEEADKNPDKVLLKMGINGRYYADFSGKNGENQKKKVDEAIRARINTMLDSELSSNFDPLLAQVERNKVKVAALNAQTKSDAENRKNKAQYNKDNSTTLYNSTNVMTNVEKKDDAGNVIGTESVPISLRQKIDELLADGKGDPKEAISTGFETIKKNGKRFRQFEINRLPDDSKGRWAVELKVPGVVYGKNESEAATITLYEPIDGASRQDFHRVLGNIYDAVTTNNSVSAYDVIDSGRTLNFEYKDYQPYLEATSASEFND